jgi:endogenous inhibitor of DNA gyrase (YacG/DUF329 family)
VKCPICGKPAAEAFKPFCSKRCADIDLGKWFSGAYTIRGRVDEDEDGDAANHDSAATEEPDDKSSPPRR